MTGVNIHFLCLNFIGVSQFSGPRVAYWLRHCATSHTVPGSIPGGVTGDFFPWLPPMEPCALRSTQPLKVSTRDFSWGKSDQCKWLTTYHPCSAEQKIQGLNLPGTPWATSACCGMTFTFTYYNLALVSLLVMVRAVYSGYVTIS
jgi:hypothetical protein